MDPAIVELLMSKNVQRPTNLLLEALCPICGCGEYVSFKVCSNSHRGMNGKNVRIYSPNIEEFNRSFIKFLTFALCTYSFHREEKVRSFLLSPT